jgi:hypothetical protein
MISMERFTNNASRITYKAYHLSADTLNLAFLDKEQRNLHT